jgi:hypothetical protein
MSRACSVCKHPESFRINEALIVEGSSYRDITRRYGLSKDAVARHAAHIPELLLKAHEAEQAADADLLLDEVKQVRDDLRRLCRKAEENADYRTAIGGQATLLRYYDLLAKVRKLIDERPQVTNNVLIAPVVQEAIVAALRDYPQARAAVSRAIKELRAAGVGDN